MSRTNPYKKKRRQANRTLLVLGEGFSDGIFLKHLRKLYSFNSGVAITVKKGKGGDAESIISEAIRTPGAFDRKVVVLDNDKPNAEMNGARKIAKSKGIELIENSPCLEGLLLLMLGEKINGKNSEWCKHKFELTYIDKNKRGESSEYDKFFTKKLLDSKRAKILELNKLILIMEGK